MKKNFAIFFTLCIVLLSISSAYAFQEGNNEPWINPFTGMVVDNAELLSYPPMFIPLSRYPSLNRPSYGHSSAPWTFELYVGEEESRPILMYYGELPINALTGNSPKVYPVSSAIFGLEQLRRQYRGCIIAGGTSKSVLESEIYNMELWYGVYGQGAYPALPLENLQHIMDKWKAKTPPVDFNNIHYNFSDDIPENGVPGNSLFFRYAKANQIIWQYDVMNHDYRRSQSSSEAPTELTADVDGNTGEQLGVENVIILFADHEQVKGFDTFIPILNFSKELPALIFRDGMMFEASWTTESKNFEQESTRMRPIRILDQNGNNFPLKPGHTWVHFVGIKNPYYEVNEPLGKTITQGTGYWKLPYLSYREREANQTISEVEELGSILAK